MKTNMRLVRINDEIKRDVSNIIRGELKDPRIGSITSIVNVDTTQDLSFCKIYVSVLGDSEEKTSVMEGLKNASGFIRSKIAKSINLRHTPELIFVLDESLEYFAKMNKLINEVNKAKNDGDINEQ